MYNYDIPWCTFGIIGFNIIVFTYVTVQNVNVVDYAFQYKDIMDNQQFYRLLTSHFLHADILHIGMNMLSLYNISYVEKYEGVFTYLTITLVLLLLSSFFMVLWAKLADTIRPDHGYLYSLSVGYSCILFGWLVVAVFLFPDAQYIMFGMKLPAIVMPLISLVITHAMVPNASLSGHGSGVLAGLVCGLILKFTKENRFVANMSMLGFGFGLVLMLIVVSKFNGYMQKRLSGRTINRQDSGRSRQSARFSTSGAVGPIGVGGDVGVGVGVGVGIGGDRSGMVNDGVILSPRYYYENYDASQYNTNANTNTNMRNIPIEHLATQVSPEAIEMGSMRGSHESHVYDYPSPDAYRNRDRFNDANKI